MRVIGTILAAATIFSLFIFNPQKLRANQENQFITVVNPVRISSYTPDPVASLKAEYSVIQRFSLSATWLLTYDAIDHQGISSLIKRMEKTQEAGIFLEVSPHLAEAAGVNYSNLGSWHFANSLFLSGYTQEERIKLIDEVFKKFKETFGYYPTSVGSWWTDSFSLAYMKEKYSISANLGVSDQFSTDGYQIWGQYWSTPFYPSKTHAGVPANSLGGKLDIVTIQWAPRDPLNGYESSLYSTQDYRTKPDLPTEYFEQLVRLYASRGVNEFGQVTVGLEGDFTPEVYQEEYAKQMAIVSALADTGSYQITNMREFSDWYRKAFPELSPLQQIESDDLLGEDKKVVWYQSPHYRLGYVLDSPTGELKIRDFRVYGADLVEPYYQSPNRDMKLSIYIPSVFDEVNYEKDYWVLPKGSEIIFKEDKIIIKTEKTDQPRMLQKYPNLRIKKSADGIEISFTDKLGIPIEGVSAKDYSAEAVHFFRQKKALFYLLTGKGWNYFKKVDYIIPQGEIYALFRLSTLPVGRVLVANNECLQCSWHTRFKHPVFANRRGYVKNFGGHPIVFDEGVLGAKDRLEAKEIFDKLNVEYIYLVKFEDYLERLPFSPGDLGVEKIFDNANSEIWKMKK